jgi:hypothetical protein
MKHTRPDTLLSPSLLRFVRNSHPSVREFQERFGTQCYHVLRKHGILVVELDRVRLDERYVSTDGQHFVWGSRIFCFQSDEVMLVNKAIE